MSDSPIATLNHVDRLRKVREFTRSICDPLQIEDYVVQSMPDASPTRWHLAHTTWFFETFLLKPFDSSYKSTNDAFEYLFNSYYNAVGKPYPRAKRGLLTRPTVKEVWDYRESVDKSLFDLLAKLDVAENADLAHVLELGLQHEQQHQELMLTDIKHVLSCNPLYPAYHNADTTENATAPDAKWIKYRGGVHPFGFDVEAQHGAFHFDNETPVFEHLLQDYQLQDRLVTNAEYLGFINDRGYQRAELWLSMGWATVEQESWNAPLYWIQDEDGWSEFTLAGKQPLDLSEPVSHVSYFEADAFARWSGVRLPTEFEWEHAAKSIDTTGNFADSKHFHPRTAVAANGQPDVARQMFGDVWEWTSSQYSAYPGYQPPAGALGEYNGKFMCNQFVLRGGSCATSAAHIRPTYRNFFPPNARWQFSGIRLAG